MIKVIEKDRKNWQKEGFYHPPNPVIEDKKGKSEQSKAEVEKKN